MSLGSNDALPITRKKTLYYRPLLTSITGATTNNDVAQLKITNLTVGRWYRLTGNLATRAANGESLTLQISDGLYDGVTAKYIWSGSWAFNTGVSNADAPTGLNVVFQSTTGVVSVRVTSVSANTVLSAVALGSSPNYRGSAGTWIMLEELVYDYAFDTN